MSAPLFAVVGHPNKGKSSLVATLARDPTVGIGPQPGTTMRTRHFPMRVNGELLYTLADTPGFQRARAALDWMKRHESNAASRPGVVARFVREHAGGERFRDECELLRPIIEGAGIIYVVDGAAPYGPEYEAEMEILRWTGQASMAIINPIGQPRFVDPWEKALGQFFRMVRVVDVLQAPFTQQIELLQSFGHLSEGWRRPLDRAVAALLALREQQCADSAGVIAEMIAHCLTHEESRVIAREEDPQSFAPELEKRYRGRLRRLEHEARTEVEAIYGYESLERMEIDVELLESDLLDEQSWIAFGLKPRDLVMVGAAGGAVAGGLMDAALLGSSAFAGTIMGGLFGGALGYFSSNRLAEMKILRQPLGGKRLRYGPTKNLQFPFVLLGRARLHHALVASRTHAQRTALVLENATASGELDDAIKRRLAGDFQAIRKSARGRGGLAAAQGQLVERVRELLEADLETPGPSQGS